MRLDSQAPIGYDCLCRSAKRGNFMRIDAHQHFWQYTSEEYGWIDEPMSAIRRDFLPADLKPLLDASGIDATIAVQARQSLEETQFLLDLAWNHPWIAGVVGWVPLADPNVTQVLERLSSDPSAVKLKGVRHVLQAEPDAHFDRDDFHTGLSLLKRYGLVYDVLVVERQLPAAIRLVDRHPDQPFVLDHIAKPLIAAGELEPWRTHIRSLALRPHVTCKLSGMVTEASYTGWTEASLQPYLEVALEAFGPNRLLFGSDWPVCTVAASYSQWVGTVERFVAPLSAEERAAILGNNAQRIYRLNRLPREVTQG
jgi:L-fuconolactonase